MGKHPDIVNELLEKIEEIKAKRPPHPRYWMMSTNWTEGFISGDCSGQSLNREDRCIFAHPWLPDDLDVSNEDNIMLVDAFQMILQEDGPVVVVFVLVFAIFIYILCS